MDQLPVSSLIDVGPAQADQLREAFAVTTIADLSALAPYREARQHVVDSIRGEFYEKPSAPPALIPKQIGSTHTKARFGNYVKEGEHHLGDYEVVSLDNRNEPDPAPELIEIFQRSHFTFNLGYLASIHQRWVSLGVNTGEVIHTLPLAPGEERMVSVRSWLARQRSSRSEDTAVGEELEAEFVQTRALNQVVMATADELRYGGTTIDATTRTTGLGLVGGRATAQSMAGSVGVDLSPLGLPVEAKGGGSSTDAQSMGASAIFSNGSTQGTLRSDTSGHRDVAGELVENISDATVQNASNVRSIMSTVVVEDEQRGEQRGQSRNVTNYNHSHALNINYYELLHSYRVGTGIDSLQPVLFLPFSAIEFTMDLIRAHWYILGRAVKQVLPGRFRQFDRVVKDFNPLNEAFNPTDDLRITRVKITREHTYSQNVRVRLDDAGTDVVLAIDGLGHLNNFLHFSIQGSRTYVSYEILGNPSFDESWFFSTDSFELDEGVVATIQSSFLPKLRDAMIEYLDDPELTPADNLKAGKQDNELGLAPNRGKLKDDVNEGNFTILNDGEGVDLKITLEYTIIDVNGEEQTVNQTVQRFYSYGSLERGVDEQIADVSGHVENQIETVANIDPSDVTADLVQHFGFHRYGYTKHLLANMEKEQIVDIIQHLGLHSTTETLALSSLFDPSPVGMTENLLIFRLNEDGESLRRRLAKNFFGTVTAPLLANGVSNAAIVAADDSTAEETRSEESADQRSTGTELVGMPMSVSGAGLMTSTVYNGRTASKYMLASQPIPTESGAAYKSADLTLYIYDEPDQFGMRLVEGTIKLIETMGYQQYVNPVSINGVAVPNDGEDVGIVIQYDANGAIALGESGVIKWELEYPTPAGGANVVDVITGYVNQLRDFESAARRDWAWTTVSLPSGGVFAEAVLGLSNASEYINVRRFFNWQDSTIPHRAPTILPLDLNQDPTQPIPDSLAPTVPVSVLNQIAPQQFPMPNVLDTALQAVQNGSMFPDMSKSAELAGVLGDLAALANNSAQLAGNLAGEAAQGALDSALALGSQVAGMVDGVLGHNAGAPPRTLTEIGSCWEQLAKVAEETGTGPVSSTNKAGAGGQGTPIPTPPPAPVKLEPVPPSGNTGDTVSGTLGVKVYLPTPYELTTVNILGLLEAWIPNDVEDSVIEVYETLKSFVIEVGSDAEKRDQVGKMLGAMANKNSGTPSSPSSLSPRKLLFGLVVDFLAIDTIVEACEDALVLLYEVIHYFFFPYLSFTGAHENGVWMKVEIPYAKSKGEPAEIGEVRTEPFNTIRYFIGGEPSNDPDDPAWAVKGLRGGLPVPVEAGPPSFRPAHRDGVEGDNVEIDVDATIQMMFDLGLLKQAADELMAAELQGRLDTWSADTRGQIEELLDQWLRGMGSDVLEQWLRWLIGGGWIPGVSDPEGWVSTILTTLAETGAAFAQFGIDVVSFIGMMFQFALDYAIGFQDLFGEPNVVEYRLGLTTSVAYNNEFPEGWTMTVMGETSDFPAVDITNTGAAGTSTVYTKNDVDQQGLLGIELNDSLHQIPRISINL